VLLAAGEGSRFGQPKALVELDGMTFAERAVALLRAGGTDPVLVVTGAVPVEVAGVRIVHNPDWRTGMGSSVRAGLRALNEPAEPGVADSEMADSDVAGAVIALVDQPLVGAAAVRRLIDAYRAGANVAVAGYHGQPRNPVLIAREHWADVIATATGDTGARAFLRARPELVTLVECGDTGSPDDVDTPADLARITSHIRPLADVGIAEDCSWRRESCLSRTGSFRQAVSFRESPGPPAEPPPGRPAICPGKSAYARVRRPGDR
jgi:nicotine blue oxidoreductase